MGQMFSFLVIVEVLSRLLSNRILVRGS